MEQFQEIIGRHSLDPLVVQTATCSEPALSTLWKESSPFTYLDANPAIGLIVLISNGAPSRFSSARSLPKAWK